MPRLLPVPVAAEGPAERVPALLFLPPDASEPGQIHIPTAWLNPDRVDSEEE